MRPLNPPPPIPTFRYSKPPRSGNAINGLGETSSRRASKVFHRPPLGAPDREPKDWAALDAHFNLIQGMGAPFFALGAMRHVVAIRWMARRANGPVARNQRPVSDPSAMSREIKRWIRTRFPDALIGIARIEELDVYERHTAPYKFAISIGLPMNRDDMCHAPQPRANMEVLRMYRKVGRASIETAEYIRSLGWPARALSDPKSSPLLHIPIAERSGIGQLGKHGSMISREYGSNFRLTTVMTDLPLALDAPKDIGVDDLCRTCRRCTIDCPPNAIFDQKQMVRGLSKWYVDFDKCIPYFTETGGCGICIEVCPWSEPGRGAELSLKLLEKRSKPADRRAKASEADRVAEAEVIGSK